MAIMQLFINSSTRSTYRVVADKADIVPLINIFRELLRKWASLKIKKEEDKIRFYLQLCAPSTIIIKKKRMQEYLKNNSSKN